ncbi:MAG: carboxypeptidase-like regulatory domain-containing protein [Phycisphaerae bacterium]|nr:carboxypeptidase-like regulatory domain-containing protein [Phycisphaerae bacterium]
MRYPLLTLGAVLVPLTFIGCSAGISGRVVRGDLSIVQWMDGVPPPSSGEPVPAASVMVTRDPQSPGRQVVGRATSAADGSFKVKLDAFAAGWTSEEWLIVVVRPGYGRAEYLGTLPSGQSVLAMLAPGSDRGASANDMWKGDYGSGDDSGASLEDEVKRYDGRPLR